MIDQIDLIEDYAGVEDVESRIFHGPSEDHVLQVLKTVSLVNFLPHAFISERYRLSKLCLVSKEVTVRSFVVGKFGIV